MCSPYVNFFEPELQFFLHLGFTVNVSAVKRTSSLPHLLSNHLWPRGCSMFTVVHLCLISPVYSYSSEIIVWCFQGRALTRHRLHQQATGHAESIRERCLCDFMFIEKRRWSRGGCGLGGGETDGDLLVTPGEAEHTPYDTNTLELHTSEGILQVKVILLHHVTVCVTSRETLYVYSDTHTTCKHTRSSFVIISVFYTHTSLCSSMKQLSNEACCHSDDRIIRSCKWTKASWHTLTQKHTNTDSVMY